MSRPVTLFTGQWADLPLARWARGAGRGLALGPLKQALEVGLCAACSEQPNLRDQQSPLVGQCVCAIRLTSATAGFFSPRLYGDGDPEGVRQRCAQEMIDTGKAAKLFGVNVVNGFTGSSVWAKLYFFPPTNQADIDKGYADFAQRWTPILDSYQADGIKFGLEVHPTEIAYDIITFQRAIDAVNGHPAFGANFDPSHLIHQFVDPAMFIREFGDRIFHAHIKDSRIQLTGRNSILSSHLDFGDYRRGWDFVSPGHGDVKWDPIIRALNRVGYQGPLSIEWEDSGMDREFGAQEALAVVRKNDFATRRMWPLTRRLPSK